MQRNARQWSTRTVLAGTLILSALPLVTVEMFPAQLKFVMEPAPYIVFHNIAEFFSIMVSLSMFGVGWFTYDQSKNRHALFLGTAFLAIGLIDFMHTMSMPAMPDFITRNPPNKSIQFWVAVRLFQAVAFLASAYVYDERPIPWLSKKVLMASALLLSVLVFTGITFFPTYMPTTFVAGVGLTPFKKISEYLVIGLLCAATAAYWRRMEGTGDRLLIYYLTAFVICIFSELVFAFYTRMFDTYNVLGHIYKVAAFSLIYYGIFKASVKAPYIGLSEAGDKLKGEIAERARTEEALREAHNTLEDRVKQRTTELGQSNAQLRAEAEIRQKTEEALRQSHERTAWLARFPEENPNPVARVSMHGSVLYCNPAAVELPGWTCAVGQPLDARLLPLLSRAMAEGEEDQQDVEFGDRVYFVWVTPFPEEEYVNVYGRDITDRKRIEEALGKSEERFRELFDHAPVSYHEIDLEGRIARVNHTELEMLGYAYEEMIGQPIWKFNAEEEPARKRILGKLAGGISPSKGYELTYRRKDGATIWLLAEDRLILDSEGRITGMRGIFQDITERKRAEEALQQRTLELQHLTETLEDRVKERTAELANLSSELLVAQEKERKRIAYNLHDNVWQTLEIIRSQLDHLFSREDEADWTAYHQRAKQLIPVIRDTIARVRSMQGDLWPSVLDDIGIVATLDWYCREFGTNHPGLDIEKEVGLAEDEVPVSEKIVLYRVMQEALSNVAKHSQATHVSLSFIKSDHRLEFIIKDNGIGFDAEEEIIKRSPWGGLGLLSIKERTELSGGLFRVESAKGKGTTVRASWLLSENN